jgi:hypothetical protein
VSGTPGPSKPEDGIESSFCKAAMARSGSPMRAATRARTSIGTGPVKASYAAPLSGGSLSSSIAAQNAVGLRAF